jgi:hypothetical protein
MNRIACSATCILMPVLLTGLTSCGGGSGGTAASTPSISTMTLPDGTVGTSYDQTIVAMGGTGPFSWTVPMGSLPQNLNLGNSTSDSVTISGTPGMKQTAVKFTIEITDSKGRIASQPFTINISNPPAPAINASPAPPAGTATVPYAYTFTATAGLAPYSWGETGPLPAGLTLGVGGILSGSPRVSGTFPITVTVTDNLGQTDSVPIPLLVSASGISATRLSGHYAFLFQGFRPETGSAFDAAGSFVADGAGNITGGDMDTNAVGGVPGSNITFTGTYSFDTTDQGQLEIKNTGAGLDIVFRFVTMGPEGAPANAARLAEFDTSGNGSGLVQLQDTSAFSNSGIIHDYIFGFAGSDANGGRTGATGRFTADGGGGVSAAVMDVDDAGTVTSKASFTMSYSIPSPSTTGRGTASLAVTLGGMPVTLDFAFYIVSSSEAFFVGSDAVTSFVPLFSGATAQQTGGPFTNASMNGNFVYGTTGAINSGALAGFQDVSAGIITPDGAGGFSLDGDENSGSQITTPAITGTYDIESSGRVSFTGAANLPVFYLSGDVGFIVGTDNDASSGTFQKQTDDSALKTNLAGSPAYFSAFPGTNNVWNFTSITAFSDGFYFGTWDIGIPYFFPQTLVQVTATFTIASNGRGIVGAATPYPLALYVVGKNTAIYISSIGTIDTNPGLWISTCDQTSAAGFGSCP